jgi:hypothetical protein
VASFQVQSQGNVVPAKTRPARLGDLDHTAQDPEKIEGDWSGMPFFDRAKDNLQEQHTSTAEHSLSSDFWLPIHRLIQRQRMKLGLSNGQIALRCGCVNLHKGRKWIDAIANGQIGHPRARQIMTRLPAALEIDQSAFDRVVDQTERILSDKRRLQKEQEEAALRTFSRLSSHGMLGAQPNRHVRTFGRSRQVASQAATGAHLWADRFDGGLQDPSRRALSVQLAFSASTPPQEKSRPAHARPPKAFSLRGFEPAKSKDRHDLFRAASNRRLE